MSSFVLGTAGHIDHGKTALVRALTGVDTDRWKEEKERGITIDLGFARLPLENELIAIVDVPGHEAFVRNMLAGASGLDAALLVVAADEGPMPQTLEHLAILDLMGITRGVVALTKADLVEADWLELVSSEVETMLAGTTLAGAEIVAASAVAPPGVDDVRAALQRLSAEVAHRDDSDLFRMPVDRAFTVRGTGTVVTGTVWSGRIKVGDAVHLTPAGETTRVRRIHVFGDEVESASAGSRAALALTGIEKDEAPRGSTVTNAPAWTPTDRFTARIRTLPSAPPLLPDQRVRVHIGTAEIMARIHPFGPDVRTSREPVWAEVRLEGTVLARGVDRFVIRSYSPVTTIGGGLVLEPFPPKRRMRSTDPASLEGASGSAQARISHALRVAGHLGLSAQELSVATGEGLLNPAAVAASAQGVVVLGDRIFSADAFAALREQVVAAVEEAHRLHPLDPGAPLEAVRRLDHGPRGALVGGVLNALEGEGAVDVDAGWVRRIGFVPTPSDAQTQILDAVRADLLRAGLEAPKLDDLRTVHGEDVDRYVAFLVRQGEVVRLPGDFVIASDVVDGAAKSIRETLGGKEGLGPADFREVLPVSRRHLVPILSHMDVIGVTVRRTDARDVPA